MIQFTGLGGNTSIAVPDIIAGEALHWLRARTIFPHLAQHTYGKDFSGKIGDTVTVKRPYKVKGQSGRNISNVNPLIDQTTEVKINKRHFVALDVVDEDATLNLVDYTDRYIKPSIAELATLYDEAGGETLNGFYHHAERTSSIGSDFSHALATTLQAVATEQAMPGASDERFMVITPEDLAAITEWLPKTVDNPHDSGMTIRDVWADDWGGFRLYQSVHVPYVENAAAAGTPLLNLAGGYVGDMVPTDGWTASTKVLNAGQLIKIGRAASGSLNVKSVLPTGNRKSTGRDATFVVVEDVTSNSSGAATIHIYPPVNDGTMTVVDPEDSTATITLDAYKTVDAKPPNNAPIRIVGTAGSTYRQAVAFHKSGLEFVPVMLDMPKSAVFKSRMMDDQTGLSVRYLAGFDINKSSERDRLDILFGVKAVYPEVGVRALTTAI